MEAIVVGGRTADRVISSRKGGAIDGHPYIYGAEERCSHIHRTRFHDLDCAGRGHFGGDQFALVDTHTLREIVATP